MKMIGIIVIFLLGIIPAFGQEIPLITGSIDTTDVIWKDGSREPWQVWGGVEVYTNAIDLHFKYRRKGRIRDLHYDVKYTDALDNGRWEFDLEGGEARDAVMVEQGDTYTLYVYYPDMTFYFTGKVF